MAIPNGSTGRKRKHGENLFPASVATILLAMISLLLPARASAKAPKPVMDAPTLPAGTVLYLRLQAAVSTKTSTEGQTVAASLAREVEVQGGVAIPFGSTFKGTIEKCAQATDSDQRSELLLSFGQLSIPGEGNFTMKGRLSAISNARETLLADGTVVGVLASEAPASLLSGVLQKLGQADPTINDQIQKQKIGQVNTAIEFPAGTDLHYTLTEPLHLKSIVHSAGPPQLPAGLRTSVTNMLADAPKRAVSKDNRAGDPGVCRHNSRD